MKMWKITQAENKKNYTTPFLLIILLFFIWGFAHSMLDVLNKHFQDTLHISLTQAAFIQNALYGGYFIMAIPAGEIIIRYGYKKGILTGLVLLGFGSCLFFPESIFINSPILTYYGFIFSLFIIGCGLTCLETSANPYTTILGNKKDAERRINFAQAFNGLGWIFGPLVGLYLFKQSTQQNIAYPYLILGTIAIVLAIIFSIIQLPEINERENIIYKEKDQENLWKHLNFRYGLITLLLYVAAQTGINSFFINFTTSTYINIPPQTATLLLAFGCMSLFMIGRFLGSFIMKKIRPNYILAICGIGATFTTLIILIEIQPLYLSALLLSYLFESIMFPTIFALSIQGLYHKKKQASSYLVMSIVGGALAPTLMALVAETYKNLSSAFIIPCICFIGITIYGVAFSSLLKK